MLTMRFPTARTSMHGTRASSVATIRAWSGLKPMEDDYLVDCIQHEGDEKHLAGNSPQVSEHNPRLRRIACKSPEEDRPTFSGIRPSRTDCKKCRNNGLDDQPETHRSIDPTEEIIPRSPECLSHGMTTLRYCTNTKSSLSTSLKGPRPDPWRRPLEHKRGTYAPRRSDTI